MNKKYSAWILGCINIIFIKSTISQNIVGNYSFEDTIKCPTYVSQISYSKGWISFGDSPDYFNSCGNSNWMGVPINFMGNQYASTGEAYSGLYTLTGFKNIHEVLGRKLNTNLIVGKKYFVSFKVNLSDNSKYATNNIGVNFSTDSIHSKFYYANNNAKINSLTVINDYTNWQVISGSFIADSNYRYIMLGNFFEDSMITKNLSNSSSAQNELPYYYIDDVCVSEDSTCYYKTNINSFNFGNNITVYPIPFQDKLNFQKIGSDTYKILIFNFQSKIVYENLFNESFSINTFEFPEGLYFYQIIDETLGRIIRSETIIKSRL